MGLFDKKYCDICGEKIGLLGNRKLEDGNLCKNCAKKLSPWFSERRHSTLAEIKEQLAYRAENEKKVENFKTTRTFGRGTLVCLDEDGKQFLVAKTNDINTENPDVLDYSQVTGCDLDIEENRTEVTRTDSEGKTVSYNPPRYRYSYDFYMVIRVNHPYFDEMRFKLNNNDVVIERTMPRNAIGRIASSLNDTKTNLEYQEYEKMGKEIKEALTAVRETAREDSAAANAPKVAVTCPWCGATTTPDASGRCEYCGGSVNG